MWFSKNVNISWDTNVVVKRSDLIIWLFYRLICLRIFLQDMHRLLRGDRMLFRRFRIVDCNGLSNCGSSDFGGIVVVLMWFAKNEAVTKGYAWIWVVLQRSLWCRIFFHVLTGQLLFVYMDATHHCLLLHSCNISQILGLLSAPLLLNFYVWFYKPVLSLILGYLLLGVKMNQSQRLILAENFPRPTSARRSYRPLLGEGNFSFLNIFLDQTVVDHWIIWVKLRSLDSAFIKIHLLHQIQSQIFYVIFNLF